MPTDITNKWRIILAVYRISPNKWTNIVLTS
jgi:hypothetical protein